MRCVWPLAFGRVAITHNYAGLILPLRCMQPLQLLCMDSPLFEKSGFLKLL